MKVYQNQDPTGFYGKLAHVDYSHVTTKRYTPQGGSKITCLSMAHMRVNYVSLAHYI